MNICVSALQLKRRKERLDKQLVAFKMSVNESLIKQTFNTDFDHTNTVFVGFKSRNISATSCSLSKKGNLENVCLSRWNLR